MAIKFFSNPSQIAEFIAFLFSLLLLFNKKNGYWRWFALFLGFTVFIEAISSYYRYVLVKSNHPFFNILMVVELLFYAFLFYKFSSNKKTHLVLLVAVSLMLIAFLAEDFVKSIALYHSVFRELLSLFVVIFCCVFYLQLFKNDEVLNPLLNPPFWIITGMFVYYFGSAVMFAFREQGVQIRANQAFYNLIIGCLNCIFYGSWVIAFIQCRKQQTQIAS